MIPKGYILARFRLVGHPRRNLLTTELGDDSIGAVTATAEVEFVQFQDGSTWGDSDKKTEAFADRTMTLHKLESLQRVYSENGEKAFWDALSEPTTLACVNRVQTDCKASNDKLNCALGAIQTMVDIAAHQEFIEKP